MVSLCNSHFLKGNEIIVKDNIVENFVTMHVQQARLF
jgi:hypothetical protein